MNIFKLGGDAYSVYITNEELKSRGLTPASINRTDVLRLLPHAVKDAVMELYAGADSVMIFVRSEPRAEFFAFPTLEALLSAVSALNGDGGSLWYAGGQFVLELRRCENAADYGKSVTLRREYAKNLIPDNALSVLRSVFCQNTL